MRKILLSILIILLLIGAGFIIAKGFNIGDFEIWGVNSIKAQNETIDKKNSELSNLVSVTYPNTLTELDSSANKMVSTKDDYENKAILISNSDNYMQTEKYEIEFLWTKLGNYAKDENVQIKIDVTNSSTSGLYDLKFAIAGEYVDVTEFIYDVENDSKLGFKIEDFHMSAVEGGVQGTFTCKEISINLETIENNASETESDDLSRQADEVDTNTTNDVEIQNEVQS